MFFLYECLQNRKLCNKDFRWKRAFSKPQERKPQFFLCEWVRHCNLHNKDFCLKWHFKNHKRVKHKFELGTRSEPKTGKRGKISRKREDWPNPTFYVCLPNFACQNHPEVLKHVFTKVGSWYLIILNKYTCFLFGEIAKTGVAEGGVPLFPHHFVTKC